MPALPPVPNVLRYQFDWSVGTDMTAVTRVYTQYSGGPPSATDCGTLATDAYNQTVTDLIPLLATPSALQGVTVVDLNTLSGATGSHVGTTAGTRGTALLSANACVLMNAKLTRRYRGGKPRYYLPLGVSTDLQTPQTWTTAALTAFQTGIFPWYGALEGFLAGTTQCIHNVNVSYYSGFTPVVNPITGRTKDVAKPRVAPVVDVISGATINANVASQRRRTLIRH